MASLNNKHETCHQIVSSHFFARCHLKLEQLALNITRRYWAYKSDHKRWDLLCTRRNDGLVDESTAIGHHCKLGTNAVLYSRDKDRVEGAPSGVCGELEGLGGGHSWGSTVLPLALLAPSAPVNPLLA